MNTKRVWNWAVLPVATGEPMNIICFLFTGHKWGYEKDASGIESRRMCFQCKRVEIWI